MPKADTKSTTPRPKQRASRKAATAEEYAALSFQPYNHGEPLPTITEWLERAQDDYALLRITMALLEKDDIELAASIKKVSEETTVEVLEKIKELEKKYRGGFEVCRTMHIRLMCAGARTFLVDEVTT